MSTALTIAGAVAAGAAAYEAYLRADIRRMATLQRHTARFYEMSKTLLHDEKVMNNKEFAIAVTDYLESFDRMLLDRHLANKLSIILLTSSLWKSRISLNQFQEHPEITKEHVLDRLAIENHDFFIAFMTTCACALVAMSQRSMLTRLAFRRKRLKAISKNPNFIMQLQLVYGTNLRSGSQGAVPA